MDIEFAKFQGTGNDFVMIDGLATPVELTTAQVKALTDRHFGIGADGVIVVAPPRTPGAAGYMNYINADGSLAQMCGNGTRCIAKYLADRGIATGDEFVIDTLSGPKPVTVTRAEDGTVDTVRVGMGAPAFAPDALPVAAATDATTPEGDEYVSDLRIDSPWGTLRFTCVSMGNPHAVALLGPDNQLDPSAYLSEPSLENLDIDRVGHFFCTHEVFPEGANIEFGVPDADGVRMRVYERGCGETLACGTGACAVAVAGALAGGPDAQTVRVPGGVLEIEWDRAGKNVYLQGPAREVFTGRVSVPNR
ncbi:MAG: diaminopimelate epimerase [Actinomycetaceae bacterium]|nr:diaminopimelate epimerase [Actinomycetaceae bacterium]MDU0971012.1 diaminopimelate epimerase [Actinomycetaceae bacterium]